ncbi:MAG: AI-2E family transporter [Sphingomonadaceae bacterium]|nr:AI-2E family transporter [Sphingomonadaceae bacterium]
MTTPDPAHCAPPSHRLARVLLAVAVVALAGWISFDFLRAILWGAIIAMAIAPLYERLERRWPGGRRAALPGLVTLLVAVLVIAPLTLAAVEAAREVGQLVEWVTMARAHGIPVPPVVDSLPVGSAAITRWWTATLATPDVAAGTIDKANVVVMRHTRLFGADVVRRTVAFVFALLTLFFLLRDRVMLAAEARLAGERLFGVAGEQVAELILLSVRGTINGLVLVGLGEGMVMTVAYYLGGVPHALLFGILTGVAAAIPMGAAVLITLAAVVLAGTGSTIAAIIVGAGGLIFVLIVDHTLRPALIGSTTRLPFLLVLVGILGGVESLGLIGLFVGPAVMAVLVMLWRQFVGERAHEPG